MPEDKVQIKKSRKREAPHQRIQGMRKENSFRKNTQDHIQEHAIHII